MKKIDSFRSIAKPQKIKVYKHSPEAERKNESASGNFAAVVHRFRKALTGHADLVIREFCIGRNSSLEAVAIYLGGNTEIPLLYEDVLKPLMNNSLFKAGDNDPATVGQWIIKHCLSVGKITLQNKFQPAVEAIFEKNVLLAVSGSPAFYLLDISGGEKRQVQESDTEKGARGSKEGFVENIWTNIGLIRNLIKDKELKVEMMKLGQRTKTNLAIVYLNNLADPQVVAELKRRLSTIDTDSIFGAGYIEEFIEDNPKSIFPHIQGTEKPYKAAGNINELNEIIQNAKINVEVEVNIKHQGGKI